jgi:hypothetical protein
MWRFRVETPRGHEDERTTSEKGTPVLPSRFSADVSPYSGRNDRSHALNRTNSTGTTGRTSLG